jgi:hypothetical protein
MNLAKVYYISLTDEQSSVVNSEGWGHPVGKTYLDAKAGKVNAIKDAMILGMVKFAATVDVAESVKYPAEEVWVSLQNGVGAKANATVTWQRNKNRSMDVGDFIVWDDGSLVERVASAGFDLVYIPSILFTEL